MARRAIQAVAAAVVAATALVLPSGPAAAAGCTSADGVSVVVDFHELGGGVRAGCVPDGGGRSAAALFGAAGFPLTYVQRQPSFVCRVSGQPASDPCVNTPPADAYWGLYWSDGSSGSWTYATLGVGSQTVPDGGSVALSWIGSPSRSQPGVAPAVHQKAVTPAPKPKPKPKPSAKPAGTPTAKPTPTAPPSATPTQTVAPTPTPTPTPEAAREPSRKPSKATKPTETAEPTETAKPTDQPAETPAPVAAEPADPEGGLPVWVGPVVVGALFAAGAALAVVRRRRGPG